MDNNTRPFSTLAREGFERSLHACRATTDTFAVTIDTHTMILAAQESVDDALVVHLLADGTGETLVVGNPSLQLRIDMANVLVGVAQTWQHVGVPANGAKQAAAGCYGGLS